MTLLALSFLLLSCPLQDSAVPVGSPRRPEPVYNVSVLLLARSVDDAEPADEHVGWGLEFDSYDPRDAVGWEMGVTRSTDDASDAGANFETTLIEVYLGARKTWGAERRLHPFVSGGLAWVDAEAELSGSGSEDDSSFGLYGRGGAYWTIGEHFNVGADVKALVGTDISFGDADYVQAGLIVGFSL
jgi:hypothetical protein